MMGAIVKIKLLKECKDYNEYVEKNKSEIFEVDFHHYTDKCIVVSGPLTGTIFGSGIVDWKEYQLRNNEK